MAFFSTNLCNSQISLKSDHSMLAPKLSCNIRRGTSFAIIGVNSDLFGQHIKSPGAMIRKGWSFRGGSKAIIITRPTIQTSRQYLTRSGVHASGMTSSQIASSAFTWVSGAVFPFYTLMILAPKAKLTKKIIASGIPLVVLGLLYVFLLYLSWTPDTIRLMFGGLFLLPQLSSMAQMFSSQMILASAWIHLSTIDLFAARQILQDGLENNVDTRHSIFICLFFGPIGIMVHFITEAIPTSV